MFHGNRWAAVFVTLLGDDAGEGFKCLQAIVPPLKAIPGLLSGYSQARHLEKILREAVSADNVATGNLASSKAAEYAIRFITLIIEKKQFGNIDTVMRKIEEHIEERTGVLTVTVESAAVADDASVEKIKRQLMELLGAAEVKLKMRVRPDLLGGFRLRIGGFYVDASLKGQMEKMKADLAGGMKYGEL